ncbi:MAG: Gfo/Idh/MocA family oxidoreductase [Verrucomicrobiota bacterium]|nr:Gfo/Idh/MocA family oxidoreductase [Verrucomicrobiota bacterium]
MKIGIIGCGNISPAYFKGLALYSFIEIAACADLNLELAQKRAAEFNVPKACSVEELLADPAIELVINLTIPAAHAAVNLQILGAGKHAYCEKPFALTREAGNAVLALAASKGLRVGCAPDTFLGAGHQTCRKILDDGVIGTPTAAFAAMGCPGHEFWHPNPEFYYKRGGGPLLDMGPYYITALVNLLGPVRSVQAMVKRTFDKRLITSEPKNGTYMDVETPTHLTGLIEFVSGVVATTVFSFDIMGGHSLPMLEIYGTNGTIKEPDPNNFGGDVSTVLPRWKNEPVPHTHAYDSMRGTGVADMVKAIQTGRAHRASGSLANHVLDIMLAFEEAAASGLRLSLTTTCDRPAMMPVDLKTGELD